jgi:membrane protease YdiL (CAAX protease family)
MTATGRKPAGRGGAAAAQRRRDAGFAIASCAVLAAYNNVLGRQPWHQRRYAPVNACATAAALSAAAAGGLTAADLGLARGALPAGWRLGSRFAAAAAAGWLLTAVVPAARPVLRDERISARDGRDVAYQAMVRIPAGTVLWEETAFRGVLQAALRRVMPCPAAIAVTNGVFGIWHIRPTAEALRVNGLARGRGQTVAAVTAGVAATSAAGVLLSWLRVRSGSLAAPMLLHLAANSPGPLAAWAVARWCDPPARPDLPRP